MRMIHLRADAVLLFAALKSVFSLKCSHCPSAPASALDVTTYCITPASYSLGLCSADAISCIKTDLFWTALSPGRAVPNSTYSGRNFGCLTPATARDSPFARRDPKFGFVERCYKFDHSPIDQPSGPVAQAVPGFENYTLTVAGDVCVCLTEGCNAIDFKGPAPPVVEGLRSAGNPFQDVSFNAILMTAANSTNETAALLPSLHLTNNTAPAFVPSVLVGTFLGVASVSFQIKLM